MDAAESQYLVSSIEKGNDAAANEVLCRVIEKQKRGLEVIYEALQPRERGALENFMHRPENALILSIAIENRMRQIENYFSGVEQGYWP